MPCSKLSENKNANEVLSYKSTLISQCLADTVE